MKFFIINLEQDIEKRQKITALCESLGLNYEIIKAVYGKALSEDEIKKNTYPKEEQLKLFKRTLSLGEIGCAMSHRLCYQKIIEQNLEDAIILEDDAVFDENLLEFLKYKNEFPKDLELLLLGHQRQIYSDDGFRIESPFSLRFNKKILNWNLKRLVGRGNGAYGYYITNNGAQKLFKAMNKFHLPADLYTSNETFINLYAIYPILIKLGIINTSSTQENFKNKKRSKISKYFKLLKNKIQFFIPSLKKPRDYV
ncbi:MULTISPECIES: glycosyltransferase family 25 protein [unclassified Campylobacter]|uniref:glycosyltransferase family 25 protein n=1 Tax=unclassified Campylobacter TaxID=2593542 RepID=UPI001D53874A|nr:glycosyltransferase family 25 protein [Campylobacter sp. RM9331]MBZ8006091.1 glycosyltransferase family 25 protein [Campylobacter sp. RM9332]